VLQNSTKEKEGEVSMELAVGERLASLECLAAEKCSRLGWRELSDLKLRESWLNKGPFGVY
jgi:hypothetical protein